MSGHDGKIGLKDILINAVGPAVMDMIGGASQFLPDCYGCSRKAIPLRCKRCGQFACAHHAYVNIEKLDLVCSACQSELIHDDVGGDSVDPYKVLGVERGSSREQIERAFRKKAMRCHPDHHPDDKDKEKEWAQLQWARSAVVEDIESGVGQ